MPFPKPKRPERPFKHLYNSRKWRRIARHQIKTNPLCAFCLLENEHIPATIADHVVPHKGDEQLFWFGELQSLCAQHHDGKKQRQERRGYDTTIGLDGWPVDPNHPANGKQVSPIRPRYEPKRQIDIVSRLIP